MIMYKYYTIIPEAKTLWVNLTAIHLCPEYSWSVDRDFKIGKAFFTCKHKYPTQFVLVLRV